MARRRRPERAAGLPLSGGGALEPAVSGAPDTAGRTPGAADRARGGAAALGLPRLWVLLRREGYAVNWKRVYRLYRAAGLAVKRRRRKRVAVARRPLPTATRPNEPWSMDFVHDRLINGRWFRSLTIVDDFTRECLAIEVDTSLGGARVADAFIESFNSRLRDECLNAHWFVTVTEAQLTIEHWRDDYNTQHPHGSLGRRTPSEFAAQWKEVTPVLIS